MARLVLGPVLRFVSGSEATVWLETDAPCEASVVGNRGRTFHVEGHHYALVHVMGLEPGGSYEYGVELDGDRAWPDPGSDFPPSRIRTIEPSRPVTVAFGSCRIASPQEPPYTALRRDHPRGHGIDALRAYALRMARSDPDSWPDALLMLGDQMYADQPSPDVRRFVDERHVDKRGPTGELEDFQDYAFAYRYAWSEPVIRWLLSTVPTSMVFDDHEINDEWKISEEWLREKRATHWYRQRITGGLMSYWIYQHLGNLPPAELEGNEVLAAAREAADAAPLLRSFAAEADDQPGRSRWSFHRDVGNARVVVFDTRGGRELGPGARRILNDAEWGWVEERVTGDFDHLVLASSVPMLLARGLHDLEAWNEAVCDGRWGRRAARIGERMRQKANMGHWASFQYSFQRLAALIDEVAAGERGGAPGSLVLLAGDVHHCYLAEIGFRAGRPRTPALQVVCSPFRKELERRERMLMKLGNSRVGEAVGDRLARIVDVPSPPIRWRLVERPCYENQVGTLVLGQDRVDVRVETTAGSDWRTPALTPVFERTLSPALHRAGPTPL